MRRLSLVALFLSTTLLAAGCDVGYTHLRLEQLSTPLPGTFIAQGWVGWVGIPVGTAAGVRAVPMSGDEPLLEPPEVFLESCDPDVLGVEDGPEPNEFVLVGRSVGKTCIRVHVSGEAEDLLVAQVEPRQG